MPSRREWITTTSAGVAAGALCLANNEAPAESADRILIPAGKFLRGTTEEQADKLAREHDYHVTWLSGETPQRELDLPAFAIDRYPVTNRQFAEFCQATGHPPRPHWRGGKPLEAVNDHPVTNVNKADAEAYAAWAGKRLPTEAEWEKAARGTDGRVFPWGDEFDPEACQWNREKTGNGPGTAPVDAHPKGASPYGVLDLIGNVAEWCADGPSPPTAWIKGGCYLFHEIVNLRPAARNMSGFANNPLDFYGFRCAKGAA